MFSDGRYSRGCCKTVHTSDILRLAVLYRWEVDLNLDLDVDVDLYFDFDADVDVDVMFDVDWIFSYGGWYTDLDTVTTAATKTLQRTVFFFSYFLLKYKRAASHIDVQVNIDLFLFKVGIAGDFVANGNMIFPSQSRFLRRLMVRADQRLLFSQVFRIF